MPTLRALNATYWVKVYCGNAWPYVRNSLKLLPSWKDKRFLSVSELKLSASASWAAPLRSISRSAATPKEYDLISPRSVPTPL